MASEETGATDGAPVVLLHGFPYDVHAFDEVSPLPYERTCVSFSNPDFVEVVIHSYRHRFGLVPGDPSVEATEVRLATRPRIRVPTVVLHGGGNGVAPAKGSERHASLFTGPYQRTVLPLVAHNVPQEAPHEFTAAILSLL